MAWSRAPRTRIFGWRTNEPTAFFATVEPQPLNTPELIPETFFILDLAGNRLTDNVGNLLTV